MIDHLAVNNLVQYDMSKKFRVKRAGKDLWVVRGFDGHGDNLADVFTGSTTEEAVANLWLALNPPTKQ